MSLQGKLSIERMCYLAGVSRAGFYRSLARKDPVAEEMEVRNAVHQIVKEHRRRYGYRRVKKVLERQGMKVDRDRVARIMREDNLLAIQPRAFVSTTDSGHQLDVHVNLARFLKLSDINQLWVADLTYIRLKNEFVYAAVILDAFSRRVVGWSLGRRLSTQLTLNALEVAIEHRKPSPGLVHHSDRGVQYAARAYVQILLKHQITPSMSRVGNPYDNAFCESFIKTLKQEEIHANRYRDIEHLRANIEEFIEEYYNRRRLHSSLGYRSPEEFEKETATPLIPSATMSMSFRRHKEIYQNA